MITKIVDDQLGMDNKYHKVLLVFYNGILIYKKHIPNFGWIFDPYGMPWRCE